MIGWEILGKRTKSMYSIVTIYNLGPHPRINNACCCNTLPSIKFYVLYENFRIKGKFKENT